MTDALQQSLHAAAANSGFLKTLAVLCANYLIVLMAAAFAGLAWMYRERVTREFVVRVALSGAIAFLCVLVLGPTVHDPRPYIAEHYEPLAHVASDNGFPSDHTLVVSLLTGWLLWLLPSAARRRWLPVFALGVLAVAFGRLAIGAHHTLDVAGSVVIAALSVGLASLLRLPAPWQRPLLNLAPKQKA